MAKPFKGTINLDVRHSVPDWDAFTADRAPDGAPNVVLCDDTGCAAWSPYDGRIEMPTLQRLLTVAAAAAAAEAGIDTGQEAIALAVFILIGTLGVGVPVVLYFALGERSRKLLDELKSWMSANNTVIMAVLILVIGAKLLGDGISGL